MAETNWNEQLDYLMQTRSLYLNDDYLAFLVHHVWRLEAPVRLIDFGCGFGYLGLKLLPLLPAGSAYTGLDLAGALLAQARDRFAGLPYPSQFIEADVTAVELAEQRYDVAICHALLLHLPDPVAVLERMKRCVRPGGLVICIEPHWIGCMAQSHFGEQQSQVTPLGVLQRLFEADAERTGKDGNVGIKVPVYMDQIGLHDIDCRVSDRVNLLLPRQAAERRTRLLDQMRWEGYGAAPKEPEAFVERLVARGLTPEEARQEYAAESRLAARFAADPLAVYAPGMLVSFGRVP